MGGGGGQQLFPGAEAGVDQAPVGQCLERCFILRCPMALLVRDLPGLPARSSISPPKARMSSQASSAANKFPKCIRPLGEGAKRARGVL